VKLAGRVAFVTGGGSGLGRAIAEAFAREGARVAVFDLAAAAAKETAAALPGGGHLALAGDVSDSARVAEAFAEAFEAQGRLDVLVNNAGVDRTPGDGTDKLMSGESQLLHMSDAAFARMLEIHLHGAFFCAREAARRMIPAKSGSILNMSSIAGLAGMGAVHYSTAKGGLLGMTRSLARDLARFGIRVNAICPGAIDTPMARQVPEPLLRALVAATPLGRIGRPEEIAATALYLASDDAGFVTGQAISPNGGIFIG
jgi:NAD(P)-dependent dehydrogenase (short-subunit alcohol dehydrogenase family)